MILHIKARLYKPFNIRSEVNLILFSAELGILCCIKSNLRLICLKLKSTLTEEISPIKLDDPSSVIYFLFKVYEWQIVQKE